jgi:hypothetical protein
MSEEHHHRKEGDKMWKKIVLWSTLIGGVAALPVALAFIWNMNSSIVHAKDSVASIPCIRTELDDHEKRITELERQREDLRFLVKWARRHE